MKVAPNDRYALNYRGIISAKLGDNEKAIEDFSKMIEVRKAKSTDHLDKLVAGYGGDFLAPSLDMAYCTRAQLYKATNYYYKAMEDCTAAVKINPDNDQAFLVRAQCHVGLGQLDEALADYQSILKLSPDDETAMREIANIQLHLSHYDDAVRYASE